MCLIIKSKKKVAKKDFYTLKVAEEVELKGCVSYYQYEYQEYNKLLKSELGLFDDKIEQGLHSLICVKLNSHFVGEDALDRAFLRGIILCKIPKGSAYYLGKWHDIVSDQLILIEPLVVSGKYKFMQNSFQKEMYNVRDALKEAYQYVKEMGLNYKPS